MGKFLARTAIGAAFFGHGTQKLFGWFDGPGLDGFTGMVESLGLRPARKNAILASATETAGGALLVLGALTPLAAASLIGTMVTAARTVHAKNGFWNANGGVELNLVMIAGLVAIVDGGPGVLSIDSRLHLRDTGPVWALAALAAGVAGSTLLIEQGRRSPAPAEGAVPPGASSGDGGQGGASGSHAPASAQPTPTP